MDTESLICRRLTAGIVYPPFPLQPVEVNKIYAKVTEKHPYQQMQHLPDGGRMSSPNGDFFIQSTRLQINENIDYFYTAVDKVLELFKIAQSRLKIEQFTNFGVKLTAIMPAPQQNSASALEDSVFKGVRKSLEKLGQERKGTGMRIVVHREGIHEIRIEPLFSDLTQIFVDLDVQHPKPFTDIDEIQPKICAAYDYLFGEVREFIEEL